jgi:hypothetical protein
MKFNIMETKFLIKLIKINIYTKNIIDIMNKYTYIEGRNKNGRKRNSGICG